MVLFWPGPRIALSQCACSNNPEYKHQKYNTQSWVASNYLRTWFFFMCCPPSWLPHGPLLKTSPRITWYTVVDHNRTGWCTLLWGCSHSADVGYHCQDKSMDNDRLVPCLYTCISYQGPFKGFHWIRCAENLTSRFEARTLATNQGQSWTSGKIWLPHGQNLAYFTSLEVWRHQIFRLRKWPLNCTLCARSINGPFIHSFVVITVCMYM